MRIFILLVTVFAAPLYALDSESLDGETLRLTRHALLQDEIRNHFGLRIGEYESLDEAALTCVPLNGRKRNVVTLRDGKKACVAIIGDKDNAVRVQTWVFLEVQGELETRDAPGGLAIVSTLVPGEKSPRATERTRYLQLVADGLELAFTFESRVERVFDDEDYEVVTTTRITDDDGLKLEAVTQYRQNDKAIAEGTSTRRWKLVETDDGLVRELEEPGTLNVSTHTGIARRLEREGLEKAALFHARAARDLAEKKNLEASDPKRQEAVTLVAKLEARLRDDVVEK